MKLAARKTGALAEAAVVSVTGVAAMDAAVNVSPANAGTEVAATHESQSPQAFINSFDKKLVKLVKQMPSSPHFKKVRQKNLSKAYHTPVDIMYISVPSQKYPGRYDWLTLAKREDNDIPLSTDVILGLSAKIPSPNTTFKEDHIVAQAGDKGQILDHSLLLMSDDSGSVTSSKYFEVSSVGYHPPGLPQEGIKYSDSSQRAEIANQFNTFLTQMKSVITRK